LDQSDLVADCWEVDTDYDLRFDSSDLDEQADTGAFVLLVADIAHVMLRQHNTDLGMELEEQMDDRHLQADDRNPEDRSLQHWFLPPSFWGKRLEMSLRQLDHFEHSRSFHSLDPTLPSLQ
jgi:hypothetical protein